MDGTAGGALATGNQPGGRAVVLENTGTAWDIYRLAATGAELANALVAIAPGGTAQVVVPGTGPGNPLPRHPRAIPQRPRP